MKHIIIAIAAIIAAGTTQAQQLPNNGFEDNWGDCTPWTSSSNTTTYGKNPASWHISHVIGVGGSVLKGTGKTEVGKQVTGNGSTKAVQVYNAETGIGSLKRNVPGYLTLGTPWNTSEAGKAGTNDGGTFGGISFTYRPDAVQFAYQWQHGSDTSQPFSVVAYSWKGSTTQKDVPGDITDGVFYSKTKKADLTNRDRNILDITPTLGGDITKSQDFKLIAKINQTYTDVTTTWATKTVDFEYMDKKDAPAMFNIVFAAGSYFTEDCKLNDKLTIDDVQLLYYSQLSSLNVDNFSTTTYTYNVALPCYESIADAQAALDYTVKGVAATAVKNNHVATDGLSGTTTIVVTNADGTDASNTNTHTYTINYTKPAAPAGTQYIGKLEIVMGGMTLANGDQKAVYINTTAEGTTFTLPDFNLASLGMELGDIVVPNMTVTRSDADGRTYYTGKVDAMQLMGGAITAQVDVHGYIADNGDICMMIPVKWDNGGKLIPIEVRFYSKASLTGATLSLKSGWQYGTFCAPFATTMPAGVTAYEVTGLNEQTGRVQMRALETVEANTPVIIAGSEAVSHDYYGESVEGEPTTQWLEGTYYSASATPGTYVLQKHTGDEEGMFYLVGTDAQPIIPANRCWFKPTASGVKSLSFDFATAIAELSATRQAPVYDLTGRRLAHPTKGINIINGKKLIIK